MNKLTYQEYQSLIQSIKYNKGIIFKTCVNEDVVNSLIKKGFGVKIEDGIKIKNKYENLYKNISEEEFKKLLTKKIKK